MARTPPSRSPLASAASSPWLVPAVAGVLAFAAFANSLAGDFVWDDRILIVEGRLAQAWGRLGEVFGRDFFYRAELDEVYGYYRPLTTLSYLWDYRWWRLEPFGYHLTNVLLHAVATAGSGWILLRLGVARCAAGVAAALFAVHPIHSESVAWIAGRTDVLAFCCCLLALGLELHRRGPAWQSPAPVAARPAYLVAALAAYLGGLLAKETAVLLPLWLFAVDALAYRRRLFACLAAVAPYGVVTLAYAIVRFAILDIAGPGRPAEHTLGNVALSAAPTVVRYVGMLLLPWQQSAYLMHPYVKSLAEPRLWLSLSALAGLAWAGRVALRREGWASPLGLAVAWLTLSFLPLLNLVRPAGPPDMGAMLAERFLYFPSLPFAWLVGLAAEAGWRRRRGLAFGLVAMLVVGGLLATARRNRVWRDEATFLRATLEQEPRSVLLWARLAQHHLSRQELDAAAEAIEKARVVDASGRALLSAEALLYHLRGEPERALPLQERFVRQAGRGSAAARNNLAYLYRSNGRSDEARRILEGLIAEGSGYGDVYANLAAIDRAEGQWAAARRNYRLALADRPDDLKIAGALVSLEVEAGDFDAAVAVYENVLRFHPGDMRIENNLAMLHAKAGRDATAAAQLAQLVARHPDYGSARVNYAQILYKLGRSDAARRQLDAALPLVRGTSLEAVVRRQQAAWQR